MAEICCSFLRRRRGSSTQFTTTRPLPSSRAAWMSRHIATAFCLTSGHNGARSSRRLMAPLWRWLNSGALTLMWTHTRVAPSPQPFIVGPPGSTFSFSLWPKTRNGLGSWGEATRRQLCSSQMNGRPSNWNRWSAQAGLAFGPSGGGVHRPRPSLMHWYLTKFVSTLHYVCSFIRFVQTV
jgi:hypothetical protein